MADAPFKPLNLLDLPEALLIALLSSAHCSERTSCSAATTCHDLRHAALASANLVADVDKLPLALAFAAHLLPGLRRVRLRSSDRASLSAAELHALAAVTRMHTLKVELMPVHHCSIGELAERAAQDWSALAAFTDIRGLSLTSCGSDEVSARMLSTLPHLRALDLQGCTITGIHVLAAATALTSLNLRNNSAVGGNVGALTCLTALVHLDLRGRGIPAALAVLAALTMLTHLDLGWNNELHSASMHDLSPLTRLRCLELAEPFPSRMQLADIAATLVHLTALTRLDLSCTKMLDVRAVAALPRLASLTMGRLLEDHIDVTVLSTLTALTSLDLKFCRLCAEPGRGAVVLAAMPRLQQLKLCLCDVGEEGAPALAGLTVLVHLDLSVDPHPGAGLAGALASGSWVQTERRGRRGARRSHHADVLVHGR